VPQTRSKTGGGRAGAEGAEDGGARRRVGGLLSAAATRSRAGAPKQRAREQRAQSQRLSDSRAPRAGDTAAVAAFAGVQERALARPTAQSSAGARLLLAAHPPDEPSNAFSLALHPPEEPVQPARNTIHRPSTAPLLRVASRAPRAAMAKTKKEEVELMISMEQFTRTRDSVSLPVEPCCCSGAT